MTKIGFMVLAHDNIFRLQQVLNHLASQDVPVAIHLDQKTPDHAREALAYFLRKYPRIYWSKSLDCDWGEWSIVEAQIRTTQLLLEKEPELDYIYHISGACLPLRPLSELTEFLGAQKARYDYIESVDVAESKWVVDGLSMERLELYHPFNWRKNRRLFDLNVKIQRAFKFKRKLPEGITPSFGSQWWCLSVPTLKKIFNDERFEEYCQFFSKSWIPDESFFQTLARKHSPRIESRSLTYVTFDAAGKPFLVYDDHIDILERLDAFFVRKTWRGADRLYRHFLNPNHKPLKRDPFAKNELQTLHDFAKTTQDRGRPGLLSQFTRPKKQKYLRSRDQYYVYVGFTGAEKQIYQHYFQSDTINQMGYLFHPNRTELGLSKHKTPRNMRDLYLLRDYDQKQFLVQRIWHSFPRNMAFMAKPYHLRRLGQQLAHDPHAHVIMIKGAWLLDVYDRDIENIRRLQNICKVKMRQEALLLSAFSQATNPKIHILKLGQFLNEPQSANSLFPEQMKFKKLNVNGDKLHAFAKRVKANGIAMDDYGLDLTQKKSASKGNEAENIVDLENYSRKKGA